MTGSTEDDSPARDISAIGIARADEMLATLISLVPFAPSEAPRIVELGSRDGRLASAVLECFPHATLIALDASESMRADASRRLARFGDRARVAPFELATLDWWDVLFGADAVVSSLALHRLNDAKKQYLYKAIANRISERGALLIADPIESAHPAGHTVAGPRSPTAADHPSALFHHLVWLKHAGFPAVDCWWMFAGHAVFGGHKKGEGMGAGPSYLDALAAVQEALRP